MKRKHTAFKEREEKLDFFALADFEKLYVFIRDNQNYSESLRNQLKELVYNDRDIEATAKAHNLAMDAYWSIKDEYKNKEMPPEVLQKFYEQRTIAFFLHMAREKLCCEEKLKKEFNYGNIQIIINK